ncbi:MAG: hypothetical protein C0467_23700 [Planctomycetaceae bacterium]|nr:hypothetical protein [Planctomycetaceae bacterium]
MGKPPTSASSGATRTGGDSAADLAKLLSQPSSKPLSGIGLTTSPFIDPGEKGESLANRSLWRKLKRLFALEKPSDEVQVSVFGPPVVSPGQTVRVMVNLHRPESADSVRTLARAIQNDAELLGTGHVLGDIFRDTEVGVHLTVTGAGVSKSLLTFIWRGQPRRLLFELHVPWEASAGPAVGVATVGYNNILVAKVEVNVDVLPRKG